jgi:polyferredoxin
MMNLGGGEGEAVRVYASLWQIPELWWFLMGNITYYTLGIIFAMIFKDNRAFCKYLSPITVFLKLGSKASLLKIKARDEKCTYCGLCEKKCPMDIKLSEYIKQKRRITSSECILCQTCTNVCPQQVLNASFGLDIGVKDNLRCKSV